MPLPTAKLRGLSKQQRHLVAPMVPLACLRNANRLPLLVTGLTGVAGFNAFHYFHARYPGEVIGIRPRQMWRFNGDGVIGLDAEDSEGLTDLCRRHGFRAILNTAGNCALKSCELDPSMAWRLNVTSAKNIAEHAVRYRCRLVHLSTDLVFSGTRPGGYRELDPRDPVTVYGKTMAVGEDQILEQERSAVVLRISLPMGPSFNHHAGAIDWIASRFRASRPATLYFDEVRSATYVADLNAVFERFLCGDEAGIFHAGGPRAVTLYQIGQFVNRFGGYHGELLKGCPRRDAGPMPPRAGNVAMISDKLIDALGTQPFRPWPDHLEDLPAQRDWHLQRPENGTGNLELLYNGLHSRNGRHGAPVESKR